MQELAETGSAPRQRCIFASTWCPFGNLLFACHSEEQCDEESRGSWVSGRFFAEFILSLSKGSE
jgi:hypothetical protein